MSEIAELVAGVEPVLMPSLEGYSRDQLAIARLRMFCPPEGYYFADSFGKDSGVVRDLLQRSGLPYDGHHQLTTLDPPELVQFGKRNHPETTVHRPEKSFWKLVRDGRGLPSRKGRWCCDELKERGGGGRFVVLGIRAEESKRRAAYQMVQHCTRDGGKTLVMPILDWTEDDVWSYTHARELPYCSLYDEGWRRLGCAMCPMTSHQRREAERWPKLKAGLLRAVTAAYPTQKGFQQFGNPEAVVEWWLDGGPKRGDGEAQECFAWDQFGGDGDE